MASPATQEAHPAHAILTFPSVAPARALPVENPQLQPDADEADDETGQNADRRNDSPEFPQFRERADLHVLGVLRVIYELQRLPHRGIVVLARPAEDFPAVGGLEPHHRMHSAFPASGFVDDFHDHAGRLVPGSDEAIHVCVRKGSGRHEADPEQNRDQVPEFHPHWHGRRLTIELSRQRSRSAGVKCRLQD